MNKAADAEKFKKFADAHRNGVYAKMLAQVRGQCGDPNWAPTSMLSAMWFGAQVNKELSTCIGGMLLAEIGALNEQSAPKDMYAWRARVFHRNVTPPRNADRRNEDDQ